jgi:hypothetical protein
MCSGIKRITHQAGMGYGVLLGFYWETRLNENQSQLVDCFVVRLLFDRD